MTDPIALIAKLEQATEGSWELDHELGAAIGAETRYQPGRCMGDDPCHLPYTTSLDAALTLVPEWCGKPVMSGGPNGWWVSLDDGEEVHEVDSPSLPLALCIAALRARAADMGPWPLVGIRLAHRSRKNSRTEGR